MAYPTPFLRLVATGSIFGGAEQFAWGFTLGGDFTTTPTAPTEVPQGVIDALATYWATPNMIAGQAKLETVKLNLIGVDGRYVDQEDTVAYDWPTPVSGVSSANVAPQLALAVTLRTGARRGLAANGRFYLPTPGYGLGPNGRFAATQVQQCADASATMLNAVQAALPDWDPMVFSDVREGQRRVITAVEVGDVPDTMRSRRAKFKETYTAATVVLAA